MTPLLSHPAGSWHVEIFAHPRTGAAIRVACDCPIGIDHRNADEAALSADHPRHEKSARHRMMPALSQLMGRDHRQWH